MLGKQLYLTREGYDKLCEEVKYVRTTRRHELAREIGAAIEKGDISENAEYDAAKDAQALNEARIVELEEKLSNARVIEDMNIASDKVYIGAVVKIKDLDTNETLERTLLSSEELDIERGRISLSSPVGQGLLGHQVGDVVNIKIPDGTLKWEILEISRINTGKK